MHISIIKKWKLPERHYWETGKWISNYIKQINEDEKVLIELKRGSSTYLKKGYEKQLTRLYVIQ